MERTLSKIAQRTDSKANILWATYRWKKIGSQTQKTIQRLLETNLQKMRHKLRFMENTSAKQVNLEESKF